MRGKIHRGKEKNKWEGRVEFDVLHGAGGEQRVERKTKGRREHWQKKTEGVKTDKTDG